MRASSYLSIAFALVIAIALVVAFFVDDTKNVVTNLPIFGGIVLAIGAIAGVVRAEGRERP